MFIIIDMSYLEYVCVSDSVFLCEHMIQVLNVRNEIVDLLFVALVDNIT